MATVNGVFRSIPNEKWISHRSALFTKWLKIADADQQITASLEEKKREHRIETQYNVNGVNSTIRWNSPTKKKTELITILSQYQYRIPSTGKKYNQNKKMRKWVKRKAMCLHKYLRGYQVRYSVEMWCGKMVGKQKAQSSKNLYEVNWRKSIRVTVETNNDTPNTTKLSTTACKWLIASSPSAQSMI